jgi:hypothetical protein
MKNDANQLPAPLTLDEVRAQIKEIHARQVRDGLMTQAEADELFPQHVNYVMGAK